MLVELRCKKCGRLMATADLGAKGRVNIQCYKSTCKAENVYMDNIIQPQIGFDRHKTAKNDLYNEKTLITNTTLTASI